MKGYGVIYPIHCLHVHVGLLQLILVAGALECPIQQHCEVPRDAYDILLMPCGCCEHVKDPIHLMWIAFEEGGPMNHFVPLLPKLSILTKT